MNQTLTVAPISSLGRLPWLRWGLLAALLVMELLTFSLRFDTKTLADKYAGWSSTLSELHHVPHIAIAVAVGMAIFGGAKLGARVRRILGGQPHRDAEWKWFLVSHLAAVALLFGLTVEVFEGSRLTSHADVWFITWILVGMTTVLLWIGTLMPPHVWWEVVSHGVGTLLVGGAVGVAAVGMAVVTTDLWRPLGGWTLLAVHGLVALWFGDSVSCDFARARLSTDRFWVEVSPACSGYEGIGLIWVFLCFFLWHYRDELRFPRAFLLLPLGTALVWLANVGRITALFTLGQWRPEIALAGFHSQAGWLAFNLVALGLLAASRHARFFSNIHKEEAGRALNPTIAYLAPLFVLLAGAMVTNALTAGFDRAYVLRIAAAGAVLLMFLPRYGGWNWTWSPTPIGIGIAAFAIWMALEPTVESALGHAPWSTEGGMGTFESVVWITIRIVGSVLIIPLVEEIAFRGYLIRRLISADFTAVGSSHFTWFSFLLSSALFGALHTRWLAGTLAGMLFAVALYRRGRLVDAVVAHSVANALIAVQVVASGHWSLWA